MYSNLDGPTQGGVSHTDAVAAQAVSIKLGILRVDGDEDLRSYPTDNLQQIWTTGVARGVESPFVIRYLPLAPG